MLQFDQYIKSDKMSYIICADTESSIKKVVGCANNQEKSLKKEQANMFLVDIQCQLYSLLIL